jgi:hypothetical protein
MVIMDEWRCGPNERDGHGVRGDKAIMTMPS